MIMESTRTKPPLEARIGQVLTHRKLTLAIAESATGGQVADRITSVAGSSNYFLGGIIAYDNVIKNMLLQVPYATLQQHGTVSRHTAIAMAHGVCCLMRAAVGVSTTGIAGPSISTLSKPVGLVYVAVALGDRTASRRHVFHGNRDENKRHFAQAALKLLGEVLDI